MRTQKWIMNWFIVENDNHETRASDFSVTQKMTTSGFVRVSSKRTDEKKGTLTLTLRVFLFIICFWVLFAEKGNWVQ